MRTTRWTTTRSEKSASQTAAEMVCGLLVLVAIGYAAIHSATASYVYGFRSGVDETIAELDRQVNVLVRKYE